MAWFGKKLEEREIQGSDPFLMGRTEAAERYRSYDRRRPVETFLLQQRIQLVLLSGKMNPKLSQTVVQLMPLIPDHRILNEIFNLQQYLPHRVVLAQVTGDRMIPVEGWFLLDENFLE